MTMIRLQGQWALYTEYGIRVLTGTYEEVRAALLSYRG